MAVRIADIFANLSVKTDDYDRGLSSAQGRATNFGNIVQGVFQGLGQQLFRGIVNGLETVVSKMAGAVAASSDLNESINKTGVVFGSSAKEILDWSSTSATAFGLSQQKALEAASSFGALFVQMGQTRQQSAALSENLVQMAADLGSINNLDPADVFVKLKAGLAGESEPLKVLNIFLNEHIVAQKAVQLGLAASTDSLSEQAKVMARYALIVEQAKPALGDFSNTSKELANAQRILASEIENGSTKLGDVFRPALTAITNSLIGIAPQMFTYAQNIMDSFANGLAAGIRAILPIITTIRQLFSYWFAPGSPPRILPDIAKWGAETMQVYLDSFSAVDVKDAFDNIGRAIETILRSSVSAGKSSESGLVTAIFGTRAAILQAVSEFSRVGSVSESTINKISRSAGAAGTGIASLVRAYFDLQKASTAATRAQDALNRVTEKYDAVLNPLRGKLDDVRAEQQKLANQQRLIADQNILTNFDSTAAEKRAAQLDIEQIAIEDQIASVEQKKQTETDAAQSALDGATKEQEAAQKQLDIAQAAIDQQVETNNLIAEQIRFEERLAQERQAAADKAEAEAKRQQQLAEQLHQAQLQYQLGISNTQQKLSILRGELANTTQGTSEYFQILGEIASLEKQAADEAKRNSEKVTDAQFQYNLELADTPGKIALWQAKLAEVTPQSAEYFDILSKIHALQVQNAKGAGAGLGDVGAGLTATIGALPKLEESLAGKNLAKAIEEAFAPVGPASKDVQALAESIKALITQFGLLVGIDFTTWLNSNKAATDTTGWDMYGEIAAANAASVALSADEAAKAMKKSADDTTLTMRTLQSDYKVIMDLINGDWKQFWIDWNENVRLGHEAEDRQNESHRTTFATKFGDWLGSIQKAWKQWFDDNTKGLGDWLIDIQGRWAAYYKDHAEKFGTWMGDVQKGWKKGFDQVTTDLGQWFKDIGKKFYDGGLDFIKNLKDGIGAALPSLPSWMQKGLEKLTDQLPGSEPKDPNSPLRGLSKRGETLVDLFQAGMDAAAPLSLGDAVKNLIPADAIKTAKNILENLRQAMIASLGGLKDDAKEKIVASISANIGKAMDAISGAVTEGATTSEAAKSPTGGLPISALKPDILTGSGSVALAGPIPNLPSTQQNQAGVIDAIHQSFAALAQLLTNQDRERAHGQGVVLQQIFNGKADAREVGRAAEHGVLDALRASGMI